MENIAERECSALGGLFQQIIQDMKVSKLTLTYPNQACLSLF